MNGHDLVAVDCNLCGRPAREQKDLLRAPLQRKKRPHFYGQTQVAFKICPNCGLVFLSPRPHEACFLDYYRSVNRKPKKDTEIIAGEANNAWYYHEILDFLGKRLDLDAGARLCDVGCGYGALPHLLRARFQAETMGLELSSEAAAFAADYYGLPVQQCHLDDFTEREPFDLLTSVAVLEHLFDPQRSLRKMAEWVKPEGYLFIVVPDLETLDLSPLKGERLQTVFKIVHLYYFTQETLCRMLRRAGLHPLASRKFSRIKKQGELWILARKGESDKRFVDPGSDRRALYRYVRRKTLWPRIAASIESLMLALIGDRGAQPLYRYLTRKGDTR